MKDPARGKKQAPRKVTWRTFFVRCTRFATKRSIYEIKDTHAILDSYDGYCGGHPVLDRLIARCKAAQFKEQSRSSDSPFNVASYQTRYECFDGGLLIYAGNYDSDEEPVGAYIIGDETFKWALLQLGLKPPAGL